MLAVFKVEEGCPCLYPVPLTKLAVAWELGSGKEPGNEAHVKVTMCKQMFVVEV